MSAERCILCGRRGERACPALGVAICPLCCGRKRRRTVDCPDDCRFLADARRQAYERLFELGGNPGLERSLAEVLHNLRLALVRVRSGRVRDLSDDEARQALAGVSDTMRTRSRGLLYDFRTPDPRVQLAAEELAATAGLHERGDKGYAPARAGELALALSYLARQAERLIQEARGGPGFVDLCALATAREPARRREVEP